MEADYFRAAGAVLSLGVEDGSLPRPLGFLRALPRARRAARDFEPDLVVGLGGRVGALALAARRGRPMVLLEGNRVVGRGVRWLAPFARRVLTLFPQTAAELPRGEWVGPLARAALDSPGRAQARAHFGLDPEAPVLLLLGGSQGARDLNRLAAAAAPELARRGWQLLAALGPGKGEELRSAVASCGLRASLHGHLEEMGAAYSAADLALSRGGASTLAELWLKALPALIVPYPYHRDRQQEHNARALAPGVELLDARSPEALGALLSLVDDPQRRARMRASLAASMSEDGRERALRCLERLVERS